MSRKMTRQVRPIVGLMLASAMFCAGGVAVVAAPAPQAHAVSMSEYQAKVSNHAKLKSQLVGVSSDLADTILQLADLNDNQIPAAVEAAESAQQAAEQAQSLAEATTQRLQAAQQDKANLEEQIKQTGSDYDDAKAAVAQLARESFHGSSTSDVLDFVTDSTTADDFVNKMQSQAAVTRSESNAATDAANELNTSMNRKDRLGAIEQKITQLKEQADQQAASAQQAASEASTKQTALQKLRDEGTVKREKLESQKSQLTTQSAKEAADIVAMKSQIDSWNNQYNNSNNAAVNPNNNQQQSRPNNNTNYNPAPAPAPAPAPTPNNNNSGGASGMNYAVPGQLPGRFRILLRTQHRQHGRRCRVSVPPVHAVGIPEAFPAEPSGRLLHGQRRRLGQYRSWTRIPGEQHPACRRGDGVRARPKRRRTLDRRLAVRPRGRRGTRERRRFGPDLRRRHRLRDVPGLGDDLQRRSLPVRPLLTVPFQT